MIALCRAYANRQQIEVVATFEDRARSGASTFGRDGLMQLDATRQRLFDVVVVEALDRLSRDMED
jgi:DNA invertase Pin-like site-specific DNA recombinase